MKKKKQKKSKVDLDWRIKLQVLDGIIQYTKWKGVKMRWAYYNHKRQLRYADAYLKVKWNVKK